MSDPRPGIYKIGNIQILAITPEIVGIGWTGSQPIQREDYAQIQEQIRAAFPTAMAFIVSDGPVTYETLAESVEFRKAVEKILAETIYKDVIAGMRGARA